LITWLTFDSISFLSTGERIIPGNVSPAEKQSVTRSTQKL